jgi:hypothetical protein
LGQILGVAFTQLAKLKTHFGKSAMVGKFVAPYPLGWEVANGWIAYFAAWAGWFYSSSNRRRAPSQR